MCVERHVREKAFRILVGFVLGPEENALRECVQQVLRPTLRYDIQSNKRATIHGTSDPIQPFARKVAAAVQLRISDFCCRREIVQVANSQSADLPDIEI